MGAITIVAGTTGIMNPASDYVDTGWVISKGIATHYPCNPGLMTNGNILGLIIGHTYTVQYDVLNYVSGGVKVKVGEMDGITRAANGTYKENIICAGNTLLGFFSDGFLSIDNITVYDVVQVTSPITFSFNEKSKQWTNQQSYVPDMMLKYGDAFFSFKNGAAWKHNVNPIANNFYGVQYSSSITFYLNSNPGTIKLLQGIITESTTPWWCPQIVIKPYKGKPFGMQSRLKVAKFKPLQGIFYADFLRNLLDPRFDTQIDALLHGEELRGRIVAITIQNDSTEPEILYKVQVKYSPQMLTP